MDKPRKFLQYARKLEDLQTARKAKEVDEIRKFDVQLEARKRRNLAQTLEMEQQQTEALNQELAEPLAAEHAWREAKTEELRVSLRQAQDRLRLDAPAHEFEIIEALQGFGFKREPYRLKQLPAGEADAFTHELSGPTEAHLSQEVRQNQQAVMPEPEPKTKPEPTVEQPDAEAEAEPEPVEETARPAGIYFRSSPVFKYFPR